MSIPGILDASAREYWMLLRQRAYINGPLENTINNTIMEKEAENDWAAYSGGKLIDATLYNIRRERRCEFLSEGLRYMDLCRWRSMDQWLTKKYLVEGFPFMEYSNGKLLHRRSNRKIRISC